MNDENSLSAFMQKTTGQIFFSKVIVGVLLVFIGLLAGFTIIQLAGNLFMSPSELPFFDLMKNLEPEGILFKINDDTFSISSTFFSYFVFIIVLGILLSLCLKSISLGSRLITEDIKFLLEKMIKEWEEMRKAGRRDKEEGRIKEF